MDSTGSFDTVRESLLRRIQEVSKQHEALGEELGRLKCSLNTTVPACRLPNELLVAIFEEYASAAVYYYDRLQHNDHAWTELMAVCKRWYEVARGTPKLWCKITVQKKTGWLKLCLERTAPSSLIDITYTTHHKYSPDVATLAPHLSRIRTLTVQRPPGHLSPEFVSLLGTGAPALEVLNCYEQAPAGRHMTLLLSVSRSASGSLRSEIPNVP